MGACRCRQWRCAWWGRPPGSEKVWGGGGGKRGSMCRGDRRDGKAGRGSGADPEGAHQRHRVRGVAIAAPAPAPILLYMLVCSLAHPEAACSMQPRPAPPELPHHNCAYRCRSGVNLSLHRTLGWGLSASDPPDGGNIQRPGAQGCLQHPRHMRCRRFHVRCTLWVAGRHARIALSPVPYSHNALRGSTVVWGAAGIPGGMAYAPPHWRDARLCK